MRSVKVLSCVAAMALAALVAAPIVEAQCLPAKVMASTVLGTPKQGYAQVAVSSAPVTALGDEIGRWWQSANSSLSNNFGGTCPATTWWTVAKNLVDYGIAGTIGGSCVGSGACPVGEMTLVLEDFQAGFPAPGIGGHAYFVAFRADETPALLRQWDFARTAADGTVFPFIPFPDAFVASSNRNGMNVEVNIDYSDVAPNFHGVNGGDLVTPGSLGNPIPATTSIVSYDLMMAVGMADPGRDRTLWTPVASIAYPGAGVPGVFQAVNCPDTMNNAYIAVGMTFDGGAGPDVPSALVGRATALECDPNLANPGGNQQIAPVKEKRREAGRGR